MRKRAKFNLSNFHNCTFKMGQLYPVHLQEVLPGDSIQQSTSVFLRFAPMVAPVMHPTYMFCHTFFIPSRVIASFMTSFESDYSNGSGAFDFESFITGGSDGTDTQTIPTTKVFVTGANVQSLADAFGLPVQNLSSSSGASFLVNALPFAAYYLIYNEYYRDQDLQPLYGMVHVSPDEGWRAAYVGANNSSIALETAPILQPCWSKDYFTTARPWPQKGPEVSIPVTAGASSWEIVGTGVPTFLATGGASSSGSKALAAEPSPSSGDSGAVQYNRESSLTQNLQWDAPALQLNAGASLGSVSINDLREGFAIQKFEEHRSLWGSRYEDLLRYLGVRPQDARLQLPEYLGGFSSPVQFSEVLQTSAGEAGGVGDLYGHGISAARGRRIRRFIPEHGYIMTLLCVRPIPVYSQGIERLWSKSTKYDFWTKELEHIGQQEVLNSEVYADGSSDDGNTFGFQNRYDEYRRGVSIVTGEFRTNQDFWTLARIFANRPALNSDFVECNPSDRIFQVGEQNSDQLYAMVKNNVIAKRLVSKNGNPI